jgi:phenylpyruvate tautomerase PptA (4-oxalocrotonate tautomerase family)
MPIVDVELVCSPHAPASGVSARALADALGAVFGSAPGHTWVRVRVLASADYAENGVDVAAAGLPAFVTVLHARPPAGAALAAEASAVTEAIARCIGRTPARVHVQYAPAGAGRQAFGGRLVDRDGA